jgi:hypothetical protein
MTAWYVIEGEVRNGTYVFYGIILGKTIRTAEFTFQELETKGTVEQAILYKPRPFADSEIAPWLAVRKSRSRVV